MHINCLFYSLNEASLEFILVATEDTRAANRHVVLSGTQRTPGQEAYTPSLGTTRRSAAAPGGWCGAASVCHGMGECRVFP